MSPSVEARRLLRACRSGALATLSVRLEGHPFASIVPFMTDYDGSPVLLVSRLAEHTKNMARDPRVSLMAHDPQTDVQAGARVTIAGASSRFDAPPALRARYVRLFPSAADLLTLDFDFHRIEPIAVRYIGGFGRIHWLETESFRDASGIDAAIESEWLARLNGSADFVAAGRRAAALDNDGIDVATAQGVVRLGFEESVQSPQDLPEALRALAGRPVE